MGSNLKSIVYLTVNTVNNKIYVGVHITETPYEFDNYYGNGITGTSSYWFKHPKNPFHFACKKYGLNSFRRYTLFVFDTYEEALAMEAQIVDDEFVKRADTYNVALGGGAGLVPSTEIEIHQYDLDGNYLKTYRSKADAGRAYGIASSSFNDAIMYKRQYLGSFWSETKLTKFNLEEAKIKNNRKVYAYDFNGNFCNEYNSCGECARKMDVRLQTVQRAIERQLKCVGFYLSYDKLDKFVKISKKRIRNRIIYQYDINGNFLHEFNNINDVKNICGTKYRFLHNAINNKAKCAGFFWRYERFDKIDVPTKKIVKIGQYDLDGNLVKVWDSYRECNKEFSSLRHVLNGKRTQTKGFVFKYID